MSSNTSRTARAAFALKSGVVMGGTAILSAVNGLTPHMAGAIDIMVVQQADGTLKCSPFYVRFGKYTPMRSKDKKVHILINGEEAVFQMHLGAYGQAYFAAETMEIVSDAEDERLLQGMMSPPSGYSSDEDAPYANEEILSAVQQEVQRIKDSQLAAQQQQAEHAVPGSQPADPATAAAAAKAPAGSEKLHEMIEQEGVGAEVSNTGSESDSSSGSNDSSNSSSSSGLDDLPSTSEVTAAIQQGLAAGKSDRAARRSRRRRAGDSSAAAAGGPGGGTSVGSSRMHRRQRPSRTLVLLDAPGDGAAADPARTNLQDLLLDNRYSIKVKSDDSFTADGLGQQAEAVQQQLHRKSRLQQEQHPQVDDSEGSSVLQQQQQQQQEQPQQAEPQQEQHQQHPVRHVGFEVSAHPKPPRGPSSTAVKKVPHSELAGVLDSTASYSIDEVSGFTSSAAAAAAADADGEQSSGSCSSDASVEGPVAAAVVSAAVAAVIAANEPAAAAAATAAAETKSEAAAAADAVAAANAAVKAQALAAVHESYDRAAAAAAAAEDDTLESEIVAMPTLSDGIAVPGSTSIDAVQQQSPSPSTVRTSLLADSLREADKQEQQQQPAIAEQQQQQEGSVSSSSSNTVGSEADALALLADVADTADSAVQQQQQPPPQMNGVAAPAAVPPPSQTPVDTSAIPAANLAAGAASSAGAPSLPLAVPTTPLGSSPPVDSGYLGDTEHDRTLGTSYEGAPTPHGSIPADHLAPGAGPLALGLAGFQLSLCGGDLRADIGAGEAQQVFEAGRVSAQMWSERGVSLLEDAKLVVKIGGSLYSWQVAAPMVVGMLAFGGKWDTLLGLDPTGMYPIKVADDHSSTAKKASSSWRLWPFTVWRDGSKTIAAPGSSPTAAAAGSTAKTPPPAEKTSSGGLVPSGGSFSNSLKLNLMGSGSRSSPALAGLEPPAAAAADSSSATAAAAGPTAVEGASPRGSPRIAASGASFMSSASSPSRPGSRKKHIIIIRKTLTPTSEQLSLLPLKPGSNTITFRATGAADLTAYIYLLRWNTRLVVSDVDGTITRSDLLGHVLPTLGVDWSHLGITQLFHNIDRNGYQIMFLSSRAIAQANITREYLHTLVQDGYKMPSGPVIISPHGLLPSLYREIVVRRPHEFKIACLQDIRALFPPDWNPFYGGFGNRDTDEVSYKMVGVPVSRTFTINPRGQIQKASTALQSSTWSSLSAINDLVDEIFPPLPAAALRNSGRALRQQQSSIGRSDWELAAKGIVGDDVLEAAIAEQQRRRSSSAGGAVTAGAAPTAAAGEVADHKAGVDTRDSSRAAAEDSSKVAAVPTNIVADGTAAAAATAVTSKASSSGSISQSDQQAGPPELEIEDIGPAREEFSDLQYWKTSVTFSIDIEEELKQVEKSQQQKKQQHSMQPQQQTKK